jgi:hypothetical protein
MLKYALSTILASVIACSLSDLSQAMIPGNAIFVLRAATAAVAQPEPIRWFYEPAVGCNLRIPCPFPSWYLGRGRYYARYRGRWADGAERRTDSYRPCPASVEFPNGRHACLGVP